MNSLLSNFGNTILNATSAGAGAGNMPSILLQALGAALRGETPQSFMQGLANQHPQLKQYDLNNLQNTAQQVCAQNGVDMNQAIQQIDNIASPLINK